MINSEHNTTFSPNILYLIYLYFLNVNTFNYISIHIIHYFRCLLTTSPHQTTNTMTYLC
jgi:hypothetical protein